MESRYLLVLTENLSVLGLILKQFEGCEQKPEIIFGSRFTDDLHYSKVRQLGSVMTASQTSIVCIWVADFNWKHLHGYLD